MRALLAIIISALALSGCRQPPTGYEAYDKIFVKDYANIVAFWTLNEQARSTLFPRCDAFSINSRIPDPYVEFGRIDRLDTQQGRREKVEKQMIDAGLVMHKNKGTGAIVDCLGPGEISDPELKQEMDRRLDDHLNVVTRMEATSAKILGKG